MPSSPSVPASSDGFVRVRGAREHNLKDVDVDVPRDALVVFSGVSGSGKSSLAFGTIYAEAQRRYMESIAPYARRLLDQVGAPAVDAITGLPPAIALQQQRGTANARSSVGSVTTISSLLRLLYSRAGTYPDGQPMLHAEDFSPNTPQGACPVCHGLGRIYDATERSMVLDDSLTIRERAIAAWPPAWGGQNLRDILVSLGHDVDTAWRDLPAKVRTWILFTDETPTVPVYAGFTPAETRAARRRKAEPSYMGTFTSARAYVLHTFATTTSPQMKRRAARFLIASPCSACHGKRLTHQALAVRFAGYDIGELSTLPLQEVARVLRVAAHGELPADTGMPLPAVPRSAKSRQAASREDRHGESRDAQRTPALSEEKRIAAQRLAHDMVERLDALIGLGVGHLALDRSTTTLSPGELQRLRLATQIRSQLFGVIYVLDEPSAGLHPADSEALFAALGQLRRAGNSLFIVEHEREMLRRADWIVDVGPGAGERGGEILYSGPVAGLRAVQNSETARYLFTAVGNPHRTRRKTTDWLRLEGLTINNLHDVEAAFPVAALTAVTGVSGSGKSSLVTLALVGLVSDHVGGERPAQDEEDVEDIGDRLIATGRIVAGKEAISRLVVVDQKPIGRTPRSNIATYTGIFDRVRALFAATPAAKAKRYDAGRFSFNIPKGRCPTCEGAGSVSVELLFMPSVFAPCPTCHGARYQPSTLAVRYRGKHIADVLAMTVDEAVAFFVDDTAVLRPLELLQGIGLGYLRLGQPATELSGGEAQRIKLATELQRSQRGKSLYVLDEPTTGLHPADIDRLMVHIHQLVDAGNTVVLVEHDMQVVAGCDWVIDLGPGAGAAGGRILVAGPPELVASARNSQTGRYLSHALA